MTSTVIERMAEAFCCPRGCDSEAAGFGECSATDRESKGAEAAAEIQIDAMRLENLPLAVTQAGGSVLLNEGVSAHLAGDVWQAMLTAFAQQHNLNIKEGGE